MRTRLRWNEAVHRSGRHCGQALVEAAIVLLILVTLTMGLIQYGFISNAVSTLTQLTREGARFAAIHGTDTTTTVNGYTSSPDAATRYYIRLKAAGTSIPASALTDASISITPAAGSARASGLPITVSITYNMGNKVFLPSSFPGVSRLMGSYTTTVTHVLE